MSDFQNKMNDVIEGFVAQITELARRAAISTLQSAFSGRGGGGNGNQGSAMPATAKRSLSRPRGGGRSKRSAADLESLSSKAVEFVQANPGLRIEEINTQLGTTTKDLALPVRRLVAEGVISTKGQRRSTTYFLGRKAK
jgi:hypothetical protein